ncbi:tripartite tricarboxylate transporter substrate binding protein [Pigmentiphaga sp. GD03639]|uniref:Bug family tripartite tricarboxylate transporter substrate binding protein n=1 Tax=unclassified Pigmentiphaga TaxID=2626614 RepID=UPI002446C702|nr:tripartite tricarboxylate transporter substrate binding protein [Pigmentiphaga sp. GD03639]MDH2235023.1 tripartite tricarboxylate transporter substrate binding protein [Pigmentiphaga sp. GD03639]
MFRHAILTISCLLAATAAQADTYPSRPITLVVPGPAGGTPDVVARMVADKLRTRLGQPVIVENKAGANGFIGSAAAAKAPADGYTLLMGFAQTMAVNPVTFKKLPYDPVKDFTAVARLVDFELALATPASVPAASLGELVSWLRAGRGKYSYGSFGAASPSQFAGDMFNRKAQLDMQHVPYKGSAPLVTDLVGGQVQFGFVVLQVAQQLAQGGKLKILAVTGERRQPAAPGVPTMTEAGYPDVNATGWYGLYAPQGTPAAVVNKLDEAVGQVMKDADVQRKLIEQGVNPAYAGHDALAAYTRSEIARWRNIVAQTGFSAQD